LKKFFWNFGGGPKKILVLHQSARAPSRGELGAQRNYDKSFALFLTNNFCQRPEEKMGKSMVKHGKSWSHDSGKWIFKQNF